MSDANMATSTKQVIISLVIFGVVLATIDQVGRHFLLAKFTAGIDSSESNPSAGIDSFESNPSAGIDSFESDPSAGINSVESRSNAPIDAIEKNFEARFVHIEEDIRELRRSQKALNQWFSALSERVARIEGSLLASAEKRARAGQAPLKSEADRVQVAP